MRRTRTSQDTRTRSGGATRTLLPTRKRRRSARPLLSSTPCRHGSWMTFKRVRTQVVRAFRFSHASVCDAYAHDRHYIVSTFHHRSTRHAPYPRARRSLLIFTGVNRCSRRRGLQCGSACRAAESASRRGAALSGGGGCAVNQKRVWCVLAVPVSPLVRSSSRHVYGCAGGLGLVFG